MADVGKKMGPAYQEIEQSLGVHPELTYDIAFHKHVPEVTQVTVEF